VLLDFHHGLSCKKGPARQPRNHAVMAGQSRSGGGAITKWWRGLCPQSLRAMRVQALIITLHRVGVSSILENSQMFWCGYGFGACKIRIGMEVEEFSFKC